MDARFNGSDCCVSGKSTMCVRGRGAAGHPYLPVDSRRGFPVIRNRVPEYEEVPPHAPSLVNSMSATGYDLESAVADIIDNSISARAASVRITFHEDGASSWIAIADDGCGMDETTLRKAMMFACIDPETPEGPGRSGTVRARAQDGVALPLPPAHRAYAPGEWQGPGPLLGQGLHQAGRQMGPPAEGAHPPA